jgi:predicted alpha/beta superfamily hydrolase
VTESFRIRIDPRSSRRVRVWLPEERPTGVLYLTDGQNILPPRAQGRATWRADETAASLIAAHQIEPIALVAIDAARSARRWEEYLPYRDPYNTRARRFGADRFADVILPRVMREVARRHPVLARARHVGIGGSSYGAIAALHAALRHRITFDRLLIESAPLWVGDGQLIADAAHAALRARAWVGAGTHESARPARAAELVRLHRRLARALRPRSVVRLRVAAGMPHHESAWAARLPDALRWLFGHALRG